MGKESPDLKNSAQNLDEWAHIEVAGTAIKALAPLLLGPVGVVVSGVIELIPSSRDSRARELLKNIAADLEGLHDKIDSHYVRSDQFRYLLVGCLKGVMDEYRQEKLDYYRRLLGQAMINQQVQQDQKEFYLSLVDKMNNLHIRMFDLVWERIP